MHIGKIIFSVLFLSWIIFNSVYTFINGPIIFGFIFMIFGFFALDFIIMHYRISKSKDIMFFPLTLISASSSFVFFIVNEELSVPALSTVSMAILAFSGLFFAMNHKFIKKLILGFVYSCKYSKKVIK